MDPAGRRLQWFVSAPQCTKDSMFLAPNGGEDIDGEQIDRCGVLVVGDAGPEPATHDLLLMAEFQNGILV
jgi:hypothetical protein